MNWDWNDLTQIIARSDSFLISAHESPDGDSLGSQLAFYKYLVSIGKKAFIYNKDAPPRTFRFLPNSEAISAKPPSGNEKFDVLMIFDCSNQDRTAIENISDFARHVVNIDHHRDNTNFGRVNCVDINSAATCRILFEFFTQTRIIIDADMATCLFSGILTDTNGFHFNNGDGSLYLIAYDLVRCGADNTALFKNLFAKNPISALKIRAKVWDTLEFFTNDKIAVISMPKSLISDYGADGGATDGMSNAIMACEGVEVGVFAKYDEKEVRFSLRSAGKIDVGLIAAQYPVGGGHKFAAGCTAPNAPVREAIRAVVDKISQQLSALG